MCSGTSTELLLSEIAPIVSSVFETMLDLEVVPAAIAWSPAPDRVIASVQLAGAWNGAVQFECDGRQACRFAARFLKSHLESDEANMAHDVLGELINIIGGNLKCALASGLSLSTPSVTDHAAGGTREDGPERKHSVAFDCSEGTFWIGLLSTPC